VVHEWVRTGYCIGFNTDRGLMLDLDNMKLCKALRIAETLLERYKLEGFLLIRSSHKNYHVVFNSIFVGERLRRSCSVCMNV